jgi:hypothetical protein
MDLCSSYNQTLQADRCFGPHGAMPTAPLLRAAATGQSPGDMNGVGTPVIDTTLTSLFIVWQRWGFQAAAPDFPAGRRY